MSVHSRLAASAAAQWIRCPGSIAYIEFLKKEKRIPEYTTNAAAQKGTAVHSILEYALIHNINPVALPAKDIKRITKFVLTSDDVACAEPTFQYMKNIEADYDDVIAEKKYDLTHVYGTELGGTADVSAFQPNGELFIGDYKNGRTVVEVDDNYQLRIYSLGAYHHENEWYNFDRVRNVIFQPNAPHRDGRIRAIDYSIKELLRWEENKLIPAVELIKNETAQLIPGPIQCHWCEARHLCEANAKQTLQLAQIDFKDVAQPRAELPVPNVLTREQLAFVLDNKQRIISFLSACEQYAFKAIDEENIKIGKYTLEDRIGNRKYIEEKIVKAEIRKNKLTIKEFMLCKDPAMMTITQMESYLKANKKWDKEKIIEFMKSITERPITGKQLVKHNDNAEKDFVELKKLKKQKIRKTGKSKKQEK